VAIDSPHDRVLTGRYSALRLVVDARVEAALTNSGDVMEILEAFT
jgi:hypothetical protein